jgi:hypothetical protein
MRTFGNRVGSRRVWPQLEPTLSGHCTVKKVRNIPTNAVVHKVRPVYMKGDVISEYRPDQATNPCSYPAALQPEPETPPTQSTEIAHTVSAVVLPCRKNKR